MGSRSICCPRTPRLTCRALRCGLTVTLASAANDKTESCALLIKSFAITRLILQLCARGTDTTMLPRTDPDEGQGGQRGQMGSRQGTRVTSHPYILYATKKIFYIL
ncbi:hypothetical protein EDB83DRAFT_2417852 [Lactarius deliciosus]|nr:hypothetical protein EDB83DRAFT_2417852 [Lactarius deliciosus]